jgi:transposase
MDDRTKRLIESENDPRILRALLSQAIDHIEGQKKLITKLEEEKAQKEQSAFAIEEKLKLLRKALFGKSSEKRAEASDRPRDASQEAALLFSKSAFPAEEMRADQKGKMRGWDLETVVIDHRLTADELKSESLLRGLNSADTSQWVETGLFDESSKIQLIERRYVRELHRRHKYKLKASADTESEKDVIITANGAFELLPGMNYTTDFVTGVVADKYVSHVPLERQTREMESLGLRGIKNSTLSRLCGLAAASLEPLQEKILKESLVPSSLALHVDETPWKIQNKAEKDGYMWVISNKFGSYYFFKPTRSAKVISAKLDGYSGPVVTDGWKSYDEVLDEAKIPHAYCWAHVRREFLPLEEHDPSVRPILDLIDELFKVERKAKDFDHLKDLRSKESGTVLAELENVLRSEHPKSRGESQKRKAIEYTLNRWSGLGLFIEDTRIPLSNNEAERTIRHAVMGRKNYYGSGNHVGAETAATLFTIIESAKKNDLDPRTFLSMSLQRVARGEELETPLDYARKKRGVV